MPAMETYEVTVRGEEMKCSGCYNSFSGWWCDNCDQWPCICTEEE